MAIVAPPTQDAQAMSWQDGAVTGAVAGGTTGAALGLAFDGPGAVICGLTGLGVGAIVGGIASYFFPDGSGGADQAMRTYYMGQIINETNYGLNWAHVNANNVGTVIPSTQLYLARNAEWAARQLYDEQTAAGTPHVYNASYVLTRSMVSNASLSDLWQVMQNYNSVLNMYTNLAAQFVSTYDSMEWSIKGPYNAVNYGATFASQQVGRMQFLTCFDVSDTLKYVTVSNQVPLLVVNHFDSPQTLNLHIVSMGSNETTDLVVTLPSDGIQSIDLNGTYGLPSGRYGFSITGSPTPDVTIAGILGNDPLSSGSVLPCLLVTRQSGANEVWAMADKVSGSTNSITNQGALTIWTTATDYPSIRVTDGGSGVNSTKLVQPFKDIQAALNMVRNLTVTANMYAQTYYNQVVAANGNIGTPEADLIFPDPDQLANMNQQQLIALYYSYLLTMRDWFNTSKVLGPGDINISAESANLLVRGSAFDATGKQVIWNTTIWTPYLMLEDQELKLGLNNISQTGFIETWYDAATITAEDHLQNLTYNQIGTGWKLYIDEIYYANETVNSVNLTMHTWMFIISEDASSTHPPSSITDLSWIMQHWYYFAAIAGAIILLVAAFAKNWIFAVIGILAIAAGIVGWYMSGDHSLLSWLGMNINLWGK
jgi:hypothetical protein